MYKKTAIIKKTEGKDYNNAVNIINDNLDATLNTEFNYANMAAEMAQMLYYYNLLVDELNNYSGHITVTIRNDHSGKIRMERVPDGPIKDLPSLNNTLRQISDCIINFEAILRTDYSNTYKDYTSLSQTTAEAYADGDTEGAELDNEIQNLVDQATKDGISYTDVKDALEEGATDARNEIEQAEDNAKTEFDEAWTHYSPEGGDEAKGRAAAEEYVNEQQEKAAAAAEERANEAAKAQANDDMAKAAADANAALEAANAAANAANEAAQNAYDAWYDATQQVNAAGIEAETYISSVSTPGTHSASFTNPDGTTTTITTETTSGIFGPSVSGTVTVTDADGTVISQTNVTNETQALEAVDRASDQASQAWDSKATELQEEVTNTQAAAEQANANANAAQAAANEANDNNTPYASGDDLETGWNNSDADPNEDVDYGDFEGWF